GQRSPAPGPALDLPTSSVPQFARHGVRRLPTPSGSAVPPRPRRNGERQQPATVKSTWPNLFRRKGERPWTQVRLAENEQAYCLRTHSKILLTQCKENAYALRVHRERFAGNELEDPGVRNAADAEHEPREFSPVDQRERFDVPGNQECASAVSGHVG